MAKASLQKKKVTAPAAPRVPVAIKQGGGTPAPASAAKSQTTGVNALRKSPPAIKVGTGHGFGTPGPKTTTAPAAAPTPSPAPAPKFGPPPTSMSTQQKRDYANSTFGRISGDLKTQLYLAALAYGDPEVIKMFGDVVPTPTGALQVAEREAQEGRKTNALGHNANNTFFSGMNLEDVRKISDNESFKRKEALDNWKKAEHDLNVALQEAGEAKDNILNEADIEDLQAFEATTPTPEAAPPPPGATKPLATKSHPQSAKGWAEVLRKKGK